MPAGCPPNDAADVKEADTFFRAVKGNKIYEEDFYSFVKLGIKPKNERNCRCWGLSVWVDMDAVNHARKVLPSIAERYIAQGDLSVGDGKWLATPSRAQPQHCTLWNDVNCKITKKFKVVMQPVPEV